MTTVTAGWVIHDEACVIPGLSFGPGWLKGQKRQGPLVRNFRHNLLGKDIVFHGKGKHAFGEIIAIMATLDDVKVRCGIYEGTVVEKFVGSEYGGGDDQVQVVASKDDIVRADYYVYAFEPNKTYTFNTLITNFTLGLSGFVPGSGAAGIARDLVESLGILFEKGSKLAPSNRYKELIAASEALVVLTGKRRPTGEPLVRRSDTHTLATLAQDLATAVVTNAAA